MTSIRREGTRVCAVKAISYSPKISLACYVCFTTCPPTILFSTLICMSSGLMLLERITSACRTSRHECLPLSRQQIMPIVHFCAFKLCSLLLRVHPHIDIWPRRRFKDVDRIIGDYLKAEVGMEETHRSRQHSALSFLLYLYLRYCQSKAFVRYRGSQHLPITDTSLYVEQQHTCWTEPRDTFFVSTLVSAHFQLVNLFLIRIADWSRTIV